MHASLTFCSLKDENSTHDLCIIGIILLMSSLHPYSIFFRYLHTSSIIASSLLTLQRVAIIVRMSRTNDKGLIFTIRVRCTSMRVQDFASRIDSLPAPVPRYVPFICICRCSSRRARVPFITGGVDIAILS